MGIIWPKTSDNPLSCAENFLSSARNVKSSAENILSVTENMLYYLVPKIRGVSSHITGMYANC